MIEEQEKKLDKTIGFMALCSPVSSVHRLRNVWNPQM